MTESDLFTPKHLARNIPENFDEVCERIRLREFSKRSQGHQPNRQFRHMLKVLGKEQETESELEGLHAELSDVSVRFLTIQATIDRRVSVRPVCQEVSKVHNVLDRVLRNLGELELDTQVLETAILEVDKKHFPDAESVMREPSLLQKVEGTRSYFESVLKETATLKEFFDYKYGLAKAGLQSLYARIYAVHSLGAIFERESVFGHKASVGMRDRQSSGGPVNQYEYTGNFLEFVRQFYMIHLPDEVVGRGNEGFADQVRKLAKSRKKDVGLVDLMNGSVSVENILEFMKRADALK